MWVPPTPQPEKEFRNESIDERLQNPHTRRRGVGDRTLIRIRPPPLCRGAPLHVSLRSPLPTVSRARGAAGKLYPHRVPVVPMFAPVELTSFELTVVVLACLAVGALLGLVATAWPNPYCLRCGRPQDARPPLPVPPPPRKLEHVHRVSEAPKHYIVDSELFDFDCDPDQDG